MSDDLLKKIEEKEKDIFKSVMELHQMRKEAPLTPVENYEFETLEGKVDLLSLFGEQDTLFAIHNMGQGCRYCTIWADGISPFLPHLETAGAVVLLSKDDPQTQRRFSNSRGWRFRTASHGGGRYIQEQSVCGDEKNYPGVVCYVRKGNEIFKKNSAVFGPGDLYCSHWHFLSLAGLDAETWTPQYNYWKRPEKMDDGGQNVL